MTTRYIKAEAYTDSIASRFRPLSSVGSGSESELSSTEHLGGEKELAREKLLQSASSTEILAGRLPAPSLDWSSDEGDSSDDCTDTEAGGEEDGTMHGHECEGTYSLDLW